jgi:hypothetical protein
MDEMTQLLVVCAVATHIFSCMMVVAIESRERKRHGHAPIGRISYAPIEGRDTSIIDYLNNKIWKNDIICVNLPNGLFEEVNNLPGFEIHHKSKYYTWL